MMSCHWVTPPSFRVWRPGAGPGCILPEHREEQEQEGAEGTMALERFAKGPSALGSEMEHSCALALEGKLNSQPASRPAVRFSRPGVQVSLLSSPPLCPAMPSTSEDPVTCLEPDSSLTWEKLFLLPGTCPAPGAHRKAAPPPACSSQRGQPGGPCGLCFLPANSVTEEEKANPIHNVIASAAADLDQLESCFSSVTVWGGDSRKSQGGLSVDVPQYPGPKRLVGVGVYFKPLDLKSLE